MSEFFRLLTPEVLMTLGVTFIVAVGATAAIVVFLMHRTANTGIRAVQASSDRVIGATADTLAHVATKGAEVLEPVSLGLRELLESVSDRIRLKQRELNELTTQNVALAQELERLKGRHIDVTKISAQLRLGLIEVSQQYHSFKRERIETTEGKLLFSAKATEFVGLQRATYRSQIGLDIDRLRFAFTADDVILVHGLRDVRVLGMMDLECDELLHELRLNALDETGKAKSAEILLNDDRLQENVKQHRALVLREIQSPQSVQHLAGATASFGLAFLQACLGGGSFRVMEGMMPLENGVSFLELCRSINERLGAAIDVTRSHQQVVEQKVDGLQRGIVALLKAPGPGPLRGAA